MMNFKLQVAAVVVVLMIAMAGYTVTVNNTVRTRMTVVLNSVLVGSTTESPPIIKSSLVTNGNVMTNSSQRVNTHNAPLRYIPPPLAGVKHIGKPINVSATIMTAMKMPTLKFSTLNNETIRDFVFVTGASSNHFEEGLDALAGVQKYMPGYQILYYDLGLTSNQVKEISIFCDVIYSKFDFNRYPRHVRNLYNYAFKPLIIQDVLTRHRALVWIDSSFRLYKSLEVVYPQIVETGGYLQFWHSPHSNFAVTDKRLYDYFPTKTNRQKSTMSRAAGVVYCHMTHKVYWGILYWWVLCALDKQCIAPKGAKLFCDFKGNSLSKYANCHRFDMSVLNVLASNMYGYRVSVYTSRDQGLVKIVKHKTSLNKLLRQPCIRNSSHQQNK